MLNDAVQPTQEEPMLDAGACYHLPDGTPVWAHEQGIGGPWDLVDGEGTLLYMVLEANQIERVIYDADLQAYRTIPSDLTLADLREAPEDTNCAEW